MAKAKTTHDKIVLKAEERTITGKQVKKLRRDGKVPANIYGPSFKSVSITLNTKEFLHTYRIAHETGIVYVELGKENYPTLIKQVQKHPLTSNVIHVDFRKIDLKQKIETSVPVQTVGDSPAVLQLGGVLLTQNDHLIVEALPEEIPQHIEIDISKITEIGQEIKVSDLAKGAGYIIKNDPEMVIISVIEHKEESVTPETTAPETTVIEKEGAEGEAAAEGEAPAEGGKEAPAESPKEDKKKE